MASSSDRKSGSSGRSTPRKRVVIGAQETVRVRYNKHTPEVESSRRESKPRRQAAPKRGDSARGTTGKAGQRLSAARREERERRQRVLRAKRYGVLIAGLGLLLTAVWGLILLINAPVFSVERVSVLGADHLTEAEVIAVAKVPERSSIVTLDTGPIVRRLKSSAWIADATVSKQFPDGVVLEIVEREPAAIVDAGGTDLWIVAADSTWLSPRSAEETGLVVIRELGPVKPVAGKRDRSPELRNALRVIAGLSPELRARVIAVSAPTVDKTALFTDNDVEIFVGEAEDMATKDRIAREILAREKDDVVYINVRVVDRPTWRGLESTR